MRTKSILISIILCSPFLCAPVFSQDSPVSSPEGLRLFHKMQEALGGADKIAAVRDFEQQVRAESWNGNTGQSIGEVVKRTRWVRPSELRVDQVGPGSTYVLYFNGKSGWELLHAVQCTDRRRVPAPRVSVRDSLVDLTPEKSTRRHGRSRLGER